MVSWQPQILPLKLPEVLTQCLVVTTLHGKNNADVIQTTSRSSSLDLKNKKYIPWRGEEKKKEKKKPSPEGKV